MVWGIVFAGTPFAGVLVDVVVAVCVGVCFGFCCVFDTCIFFLLYGLVSFYELLVWSGFVIWLLCLLNWGLYLFALIKAFVWVFVVIGGCACVALFAAFL